MLNLSLTEIIYILIYIFSIECNRKKFPCNVYVSLFIENFQVY